MKIEVFHIAMIFFLALGLGLYLTPLMAVAGRRFGLVAKPDGKLRLQKEPVPYMGGIAIYLSFLIALVFGFGFEKQVLGLLLGGTIIILVGLIDDFGVMTPWMKLFGQIVAVIAMLKSGIHLEVEIILDLEPIPEFPILSYLLSGLWLVILMNAFNFLDIEDGLSGGVAFFSGLGLLVVSLINQEPVISALTCALVGGILGFLFYNFQPAKIYMGDTGSLFLGIMLGALAMIGKYTEHHSLGLFTPALILGIALFEICFTSFARLVRGKPIMQGSQDHIAKRLEKLGLSVKKTVLLIYFLTIIFSGAGLLAMISSFRVALVILLVAFGFLLLFALFLFRVKIDSK